MFVCKKIWKSIIIQFLFVNIIYSQIPQFKTFTTQQGLSTYNTRKIIRDNFGFLWITTQDGMNRFDGTQFTILNKNTGGKTSLGGTYVTDCCLDNNGNIWVGSEYGGVDEIDPSNLTINRRFREDEKDGLISNWVRAVCYAGNDEIWIGTYYGLSILNKTTNHFTNLKINHIDNNEPLNIACIGRDSLMNMWLGIENGGLIVMNKKKEVIMTFDKNNFELPPGAPLKISGFYADKKGLVFACTNAGLKVFRPYKNSYVLDNGPSQYDAFKNMEVHTCLRDKHNNFWVGSSKGAYLISNETILAKHEALEMNTILNNYINYIYEDNFNNIWIACSKGLNLLLNTPYYFENFNYDVVTKNALEHCYSLSPVSDSIVLASTISGLYSVNIKKRTHQKIVDIGETGLIDAIFRKEKNQFIISGEKQTAALIFSKSPQLEQLSKYFPELVSLEKKYLSKIKAINDSIILFGSRDESGLYIWNTNSHTLKRQIKKDEKDSSGIYDNSVQNIYTDRNNNTWILSDLSLSKYNLKSNVFKHNHPRPGVKDSINSNFLMDMYDDGKNYWITTYGGGVNIINKKTFSATALTTTNGLPANTTYSIIPENDSVLWVSTNNGLSRINTHSLKIETYSFESGLQLNSFEIRSCFKENNSIFFGGIDGFIKIVENKRYHNINDFPVYISKIFFKKDDYSFEFNELDRKKIYTIPPAPDQIVLYISALGFSEIHNYTYQYRLRELNSNWIDMKNKNTINFSNLPSGTYHIESRVTVNGTKWNYSQKIIFRILPKWYQTWWFYLLIILTVAAILYALYRYRIAQIKKQHEIRKNIATDLHDDLGSTLNSVKVFTNLAISGVKQEESLQQIKDNLKEATTGLRDMIWVLDDSLDTVDELVTRLKQFALPVAAASNIKANISCETDINNRRLTKEEKRNLFLVCKEAINNSIKYSEATLISISIVPEGKKIKITITDNGKGFDVERVKKGYGLKNMEYRAEQVKYKVIITTAAGAGTTMLIRPL